MLKKMSADTNAINWFEIPVIDIDRAKTFYETILNIKMVTPKTDNGDDKMVMFPRKPDTIMALSGILSGCLVKSKKSKPSKGGVLIYLNASPSIQKVIDKIETAGGKVIQPKIKIPAGYISIFIDTEGNRLGLSSGA
jgi:uncharacterized protein